MADAQTVREQLDALAAFPAQLRALVAGLSDEALRFRPAPGEWSIVENIGHLIDIDTLQGRRVGQIIARDNPPIEPFDVDEAVRRNGYQDKQASALLNTFAERRAALVEEWRYIRPANLGPSSGAGGQAIERDDGCASAPSSGARRGAATLSLTTMQLRPWLLAR